VEAADDDTETVIRTGKRVKGWFSVIVPVEFH
jgi:hypothetical protein